MILGFRVALRHRNVRKFVRSVRARTEKARERGLSMRETRVEKPSKSPRASAIELQQVRSLLREVDKTNARKKYDDSEKSLIKALTLDPHSLEARAALAKLYLLTDRNAKAEALYRGLLQDAEEVSFYANLGLACYKQRKFDDSRLAYRSAMELDPRSPERVAALGRACMACKKLTEAADLLEKASERMARDTDLLRMLAQCYERLGHTKEAADAYVRIHRLQPYDEAVKQKISELASV